MVRISPEEAAATKKAEEEKEAKKAKALADKARRKAEAEARKKAGDADGGAAGGDGDGDGAAAASTAASTGVAGAAGTAAPRRGSAGTATTAASASASGLDALEAKAKQASIDKEELGGEAEHRRLMASAMERLTVTTSTYQSKVHPNSRDIKISNLSLVLKGKELLAETDLNLSWGHRYGLLGPNGCGKSILLTLVGKRLVPLPANMDSFHLVSEVDASDLTAMEAVMAVDTERASLEATAAEIEEAITGEDSPEQVELSVRLSEIYERLEEMGAATAESRASQILFGLGFDSAMQAKQCKSFSGGWRMRVALARALFLGPSLLLLDEPTNHLDMEAVVWLERHLATFSKILVMVSHSQDFMNEVCTQVIRIHKKKLEYFGGNYDQYVETRNEKEKEQMAKYEWEQEQMAHMKDFIARFGHGTRKMAMQAQSREKVLQKMQDAGLVEKVEFDRRLNMTFPNPSKIPPPVLMLANISFRYSERTALLYENVDFGVDLDSRIALVGPNGAGKTTLLKLIAGELVPTGGAVRPNPHLRMARYTQHFVDALDLSQTPLEYFQTLMPDVPIVGEGGLRSKLGRFGISGENQTEIMAELSDGIKSRVVFALMATKSPHILLLDEPTNHLDIETIDALAEAIQKFEGGVILVSHDMRLIDQVAKEIYECDKCRITKVAGDITGYKKMLQRKLENASDSFERARKAKAAGASGAGSGMAAATAGAAAGIAGAAGGKSKAKPSATAATATAVPPQAAKVAPKGLASGASSSSESGAATSSSGAASVAPASTATFASSGSSSAPLAVSAASFLGRERGGDGGSGSSGSGSGSGSAEPAQGGLTALKFSGPPRLAGAGSGGWRERLAAKEAAAAAAAAGVGTASGGSGSGSGGGSGGGAGSAAAGGEDGSAW